MLNKFKSAVELSRAMQAVCDNAAKTIAAGQELNALAGIVVAERHYVALDPQVARDMARQMLALRTVADAMLGFAAYDWESVRSYHEKRDAMSD